MVRFVACMLMLALESFVSLIYEAARTWLLVKPWKRFKVWRGKRKLAKTSWAEHHLDETTEDFNSQPDEVSMDAVKGALKSRLIWLGVAQVVYGLVNLWANGMLTIDSAGPVVSGAVTIWLRALTKESLVEKALK